MARYWRFEEELLLRLLSLLELLLLGELRLLSLLELLLLLLLCDDDDWLMEAFG